MATITSIGSGLWSAAGTWDAGVPLDGDDVIISAGHTVTFDVDQSAFVTGVSVTITGTLIHTTAAGTYVLKAKTGASITGAGTWNVGTQGSPIPFSSKHLITGASGWQINGISGLTLSIFGTDPQHTIVKLSSSAAALDTVINVDTDLTSSIWSIGDSINICNIASGRQVETRTISNITSTTITVTAGLTASKLSGSVIHLLTRNIRFVHNGTGITVTNFTGSFGSPRLTIGSAEIAGDPLRTFCNNSHFMSISGGVFHSFNRVFQNLDMVITGGVFTNNGDALGVCARVAVSNAYFSGNNNAVNACSNAVISNCFFYGNHSAFFAGNVFLTNPTVIGNNAVFYLTQIEVSSGIFDNNWAVFREAYGKGHNIEITNGAETWNHTGIPSTLLQLEVTNFENIPGNYKSWMRGGIITSDVSVIPAGYPRSYKFALGSANFECWYLLPIIVAAGETVIFEFNLRKDALMSYLPRAYLTSGIDNPLAGATPVQSFVMTDSIDTWENHSFTVTNSTTLDQPYSLWFIAKSASNNFYAAYRITTIPDSSDIATAVWSFATKELTTPTNYMADVSALATSAELAALNDLDAAGIRAAIGLALANIDQQFLNTIGWQAIRLDESITEGEIIQIRGNSWVLVIEDLALDPNKQQFAIRQQFHSQAITQGFPAKTYPVPDSDAVLFVDSDTGLLYINGIAAADPTLGTLTYVGTTLTLTLAPSVTTQLPPGTYTFGIQSIDPAGLVSEPYGGTFTITADVVRSIT